MRSLRLTQDFKDMYSIAMTYIIVGLGNPGEEYENTRHNTGRMVLQALADKYEARLVEDKKINALRADVKIGSGKAADKAILIAPETFMNRSGKSVAPLITGPKKAEKLIVIYDDFQLPLGRIKISYNRSSGGHNGLESVIKAVKTEAFIRLRIGVAPANSKGQAKVPSGADAVEKFILGKLKKPELEALKKISKKAVEALELIVTTGRELATGVVNSW